MSLKRKKKSALVAWLEYAMLRATCAVVNAIPYRLACAFARGAAWTLVRCLGFKRKRTIGRIRSVFPDLKKRLSGYILFAPICRRSRLAENPVRSSDIRRDHREKKN